MYEKYWELEVPPFENVPDPRFIYWSSNHEEAYMRLMYAAKGRKGAAMLTGEVGCGKTTLSRAFVQELSANNQFDIALIANPSLPPKEFLQEILFQFGISNLPPEANKADLLHMLNAHMLQNMKNKKESIIIIDEAQIIEDERTFEEIRLLLNFQLNERFLLTLILLGQPELKGMVEAIKQLDSRISIKYHLAHLDLKETANYILFRLKKAGMQKNVFTKEAIIQIQESSGGIPRRINNICDLALLVGYSAQAKVIDSRLIQKVISDAK